MGPAQHRYFENFLQVPEGLSEPLVNVIQLRFACPPGSFNREDGRPGHAPATGIMVIAQEQFSHLLWVADRHAGMETINESTDLLGVGIVLDGRWHIARGTEVDNGKGRVHGHRAFIFLAACSSAVASTD